MFENENDYYIYEHYNNNGIVYYVGISSTINRNGNYIGFKRAKEKHFLHNNWMNYIEENNINWDKNNNALKQNCKIIDGLNLNEAIDLEKLLIKKYGRIGIEENGLLINRKIGGGNMRIEYIPKLIISNLELENCKSYIKKLKNDITNIKQFIYKCKTYSKESKEYQKEYQKEYRKNHKEYNKKYHKEYNKKYKKEVD